MGSEPVVIRSGRCTSQISIYDYPEHLNPFYEDENHKRLRFWKLGKRNGESRRGSFSLNGLKEMWAFKSFRLKKKSSTLGINKTSESPPPLRRELNTSELHYGTYDPRMRHTTGAHTLNGYFQRNAPYRSSLQDMREDINRNDIGFTRNDRYRSTIQTAGMISKASGLSPRVPERRSSQLSVASTNPFDEDEDDIVVGKISASDSSENKIHSPTKRPARKKRRAPPPPVPVPKVIVEESSRSPTTPSTSHNNQNENGNEENIDITNLTAEIESFVKIKTNSSEDISNTSDDKAIDVDNKVAAAITTTTTTTTTTTISTIDCTVAENTSPVQNETPNVLAESSAENVVNINVEQTKAESEEIITKDIKSNTAEDNANKDNENENKRLENQNELVIQEVAIQSQSAGAEQPRPVEVASVDLSEESDLPTIELKITESKEDLSERSETSNETITNSKFHVRYIPLKESSPESETEAQSMKNTWTKKDEAETSEAAGHEKRRSVKEIIASINRSQSLLKVNQDQMRTGVNNLDKPIRVPPRRKNEGRENLIRNFKDLSENENEIKKMLREMENTKSTQCENKIQTENEVNEMIEKLVDKLNNNEENNKEIFKKCSPRKEINRESSPTASNLDWNPVPKPKRTKNLSPELVRSNGKSEN